MMNDQQCRGFKKKKKKKENINGKFSKLKTCKTIYS